MSPSSSSVGLTRAGSIFGDVRQGQTHDYSPETELHWKESFEGLSEGLGQSEQNGETNSVDAQMVGAGDSEPEQRVDRELVPQRSPGTGDAGAQNSPFRGLLGLGQVPRGPDQER